MKKATALSQEEAEDMYSLIVSEIDTPIVVANARFEIEWVNPAFTRTFGYTLEQFIKTRGKTILQASQNPDIEKILNKAINQRRVVKYESKNTSHDGKDLWISSTVKPVFKDDGELFKIIITDLDVNEKKKIEQKLELTDVILQKVGSLVLVANGAGEIVYVSPSVSKATGYEARELLGTGWWNMSRKTEWESEKERRMVAEIASGLRSVDNAPYERSIVCNNGDIKWILWKDTKGPGNLLIGVGTDITDRKNADELIREKTKDLTDSINYATRIQNAAMSTAENYHEFFPESFVLYIPKDIVSGDFYWFNKALIPENNFFSIKAKPDHQELFLAAAADCTGHGVPGALMSIAGISQLNQISKEHNFENAGQLVSKLNTHLSELLRYQEGNVLTYDSMDIGLCCYETKNKTLHYSGANRPLYHYRNGQLTVIKSDKSCVGGSTPIDYVFKNTTIKIEKGDMVYLFTDGYTDQFGGPEGKKFLNRRLKDMCATISKWNISEQEAALKDYFFKWKGKRPQVDDVLVIGIKF